MGSGDLLVLMMSRLLTVSLILTTVELETDASLVRTLATGLGARCNEVREKEGRAEYQRVVWRQTDKMIITQRNCGCQYVILL